MDVDTLEGDTDSKTEIKNKQEQDIVEEKRSDINGDEKKDTEREQERKIEGNRYIESEELKKLLEWFALALFGRHVRAHEVQTWRTRCSTYLELKREE
jgi:hypothetical protein